MPGPQRPRRRRTTGGRWAATALAPLLAACSVADNLSGPELIEELDRIAAIESVDSEWRLRYEDAADVSAWYMRFFLFVPIRGALGWSFGRTTRVRLDHAAGHVRELLRELPDETGGDLVLCAQTATRGAWLAELDRSTATKIVGLDGVAAMATQLGLPTFQGEHARFLQSIEPARFDEAQAVVQASRRSVRGDAALSAEALEAYGNALAALTARPLAGWADRVLLVEDLTALLLEESRGAAEPLVDSALRRALVHLVEGLLARMVQGRETELVEARLCAMEQMRRLGGPSVVPLMLALMAASPEAIARGESKFDPDSLVQLRLIHYCGQLDAARAATEVQLSGRAAWEVTSPADFLATTILIEQAYYSRLRTPALVALTWCLRRPTLDLDVAWVRRFRENSAP